MNDTTQIIHLVRECCRDSSRPLRAFHNRESAEDWKQQYVADFDELDGEDWAEYHVGMGGKVTIVIDEVPVGAPSSDSGVDSQIT